MKKCRFQSIRVFVAAGFATVATVCCARAVTNGLTVDDVIQRAVEESKRVEKQDLWDQFAFNRHTIVKEIDKSGKVREMKELWYDIDEKSEFPRLREVKINGQLLTGAKLQAEIDAQVRTRKAMAQKSTPAKRDAGEIALNAEMVSRYHFVLLGIEKVHDRDAYAIAFRPRNHNLPVKEMADRLLNQIYGRLWIDCEDFEVARADIRLQAEVKLWAGLLAALHSFTFTVERVRLGERIWFNSLAVGDFEGRKLLDPSHVWLEAESTNYHRINPPSGATADRSR